MERDYKRMRAEAAEQAKGQGLDGRVPAAEIKDALKRQKLAPEDEGGPGGAAGSKEDSSLPHAAALAGSEAAAEAQEAQGGEPQAEKGAQDGTGEEAQAQAQAVAEVPAAAPAQAQVQAQGELGAAKLGVEGD